MKIIGLWSLMAVTLLAFGLAGYGGASSSQLQGTEVAATTDAG